MCDGVTAAPPSRATHSIGRLPLQPRGTHSKGYSVWRASNAVHLVWRVPGGSTAQAGEAPQASS
jgi:hypothetical protein